MGNSRNQEPEEKQEKPKRKPRKSYKKKRVIVPIILTFMFIFIGAYCLIHSYYYQSTDDAFVEGHIVTVPPKTEGNVIKVNIDDNQPVKAGDVLVELDPKYYQLKLDEAEAKLAEAKAALNVSDKQINQAESNVEQTSQDITSTNSKLDFAKKDYKRYSSMYKIGASSKQDYDSSSTGLTVAKSSHNAAKQKLKATQAELQSQKAKRDETLAQIKKLEAEVNQAKLFLSYTKIKAPQDGNITSKNVEVGNHVEVGQPLFAIVPEKMWVIANFKETQLTNIRKGQPVDIKIDTYSGVKFKGKVDSIQRATGAKASLFPPENAVGSYVKIVQRVPVKILIEGDYLKYNIVPGMSVVPEVKIR